MTLRKVYKYRGVEYVISVDTTPRGVIGVYVHGDEPCRTYEYTNKVRKTIERAIIDIELDIDIEVDKADILKTLSHMGYK